MPRNSTGSGKNQHELVLQVLRFSHLCKTMEASPLSPYQNFLYRWKGNVFDKYCAPPCTAAEKLLVWWTSGPFQEGAEVNFSVWYDLLNILKIKYSFLIYNILIKSMVLGIFPVIDWPTELPPFQNAAGDAMRH